MQPKDRQRETGDGQLSFLKSAGMHLQVDKYPMIGRAKCAKDLCKNGQQWSQSDSVCQTFIRRSSSTGVQWEDIE